MRIPLSVVATLAVILPAAAEDPSAVLQVFEKNCVECHGKGEKVKGDVDLMAIRSGSDLSQDPELLKSIIDAIDFEEMPPEDEPQLEPDVRAAFLADLKGLLRESLAETKVYPRTPIRRMNRFQYNNAVVDLFRLNREVFSLPEKMMREHDGYFQPATGRVPDVVKVGSRPLGKSQLIEPRLAGVAPFPQDLRAEHGFDNQADHLSMSPLLMEAFLRLGQSITESDDFNPKTVGHWKSLFAPPAGSGNAEQETRRRLRVFLTMAFRRPVEEDVLDRYAGFLSERLEAGVRYDDAVAELAAAVIASPRFLYLYDRGTAGKGTVTVDHFELASRMSFFLWGSIPDNELLDLAGKGELGNPDVLSKQIDRMLADRRLKRFCDSFPTQWLQLERIVSSTPSREKYPDFYFSAYRNSMHMMIEPLLLFETVLIENRPITELIDPGFSYRSGQLEKAYGKLSISKGGWNLKQGGVQALSFTRLPVRDRRNGGVITNAAVMTMTSGPERSQPITRGAWVATVIFNNPPNPPPADVPPLEENHAEEEKPLTLRERLAMHRERADCRGCHEKIDPLGFALENYNAIGRWRDDYENGREVDVSDTLFRKHRFASVIEFKDAILAEKDRFTRGLAGHMLSFALARELGAADQPALDRIAAATAADDYRMKTLIREVILSEPFRSKTLVKAENTEH
ncbi:hypothetical protein HAHE_29430 [Haloferula helveola]|uniref:Cytochrome c domain-containing protein n=1 Tax=Haloferula helveola TaxID=490095 RepID=A0ABN6H5U5_9BACT|nr:hypothetical protein HAHE_29430 [Haloferula helveola]